MEFRWQRRCGSASGSPQVVDKFPARWAESAAPCLRGAGEGLLARRAETPDLTLRALTMELATLGVLVARDTVWHFVRKAGQTVKQRP